MPGVNEQFFHQWLGIPAPSPEFGMNKKLFFSINVGTCSKREANIPCTDAMGIGPKILFRGHSLVFLECVSPYLRHISSGAKYSDQPAKVTLNGGSVKEFPKIPLIQV